MAATQIDGVDAHATPGDGAALTPWVFGSSKGQSAQVAGANGLPFVASYHITPATALDAIEVYRAEFQPSKTLSEPYVVVSADIVVADDTATATHLASSYGHWVHSIRAGDGAIPYPDPDKVEPLSDEQRELVKDRTATQFVGDPDQVAEKLDTLQRVTAADELVITSVTHGHADRLRSHQLIAERWGLSGERKQRKQIHLGALLPGVNGRQFEFDSIVHVARSAERGLFDFVLLADPDVVGGPDTFSVLAALAAVTDRLGLAGPIDTTSKRTLRGGKAIRYPGPPIRRQGRLERGDVIGCRPLPPDRGVRGRRAGVLGQLVSRRGDRRSGHRGLRRPRPHPHGAAPWPAVRRARGRDAAACASGPPRAAAGGRLPGRCDIRRHARRCDPQPVLGSTGRQGYYADVKARAANHGRDPNQLMVFATATPEQFVGTPAQVADEIDLHVQTDACDGFIMTPPGLDAFVDRVVPLLRQRGSFRTEYAGHMLRDHLGL